MKKWKTVLVGCGSIANAWLDAIKTREDIELCALVDLNRESAETLKITRGLAGAAVSTDLPACLCETGAELVFDCTVPAAHHKVVLAAIASGCHVFGEKPLADTMEQARDMVRAAEQAGVRYGVMQNRRWQPEGIQRVRAALNQKLIGELHTVHADFFMGIHFGGFRDEMKHVLLKDMAIHSFDQIRCLLDAKPLSVWASDWNPSGSWYADGASAVAFFTHENNTHSSYRGSWCAEGLPGSWQCQWRLIGTEGTLLWDGDREIKAERISGNVDGATRPCIPVEIPPENPAALSGHAAAIHDFIQSLQEDRLNATPASDNIFSLAMVEAAILSAESGKSVSLDNLITE